MKVILCGYHWTGCEALRQLLSAGHEVFVYTHEGPYHVPCLIDYCNKHQVGYSTENVSKSRLPFQPDCVASIYYRHIIKQAVIDACQGRIFNLHPSLLPAYRGCSSLTWAMIEGEQHAGFTFHYIDAGCDTGDIICQRKIEILDFDTQSTLYQRVQFEAMKDFALAFEFAASGKPGKAQQGEASLYKRGCPHGGEISSDWDEARTERFIRAMIYPPFPPASFRGSEIHSWEEFSKRKSAA